MEQYRVTVSEEAKEDIFDLFNHIFTVYKSPLTAERYIYDIYNKINKLSDFAEIYQIQRGYYFLQFGNNVRRLNYKKIAIIYTVVDTLVTIHRVIPSSLITDI